MFATVCPSPGGCVNDSSRSTAITIVLAALLLMIVARLSAFLILFGRDSLQADFSAFYTSGQAIRGGLSPYQNQITHTPPIWDGIDTYRHSRYLYPPTAAIAFSALASLPYRSAKIIWMTISLIAIAVGLYASTRLTLPHPSIHSLLVIALVACAFHPLLCVLERGEDDAITFAFILFSVLLITRSRNSQLLAGVLLALGSVFKLVLVFIIPFLLWRRQWRALAGYAAGGILLLALTVLVLGIAPILGYVTDEMPRIAKFGEDGNEGMKLPTEVIGPHLAGVPAGETVKDGQTYNLTTFQFVTNATLVRIIKGKLHALGTDTGYSSISLPLFIAFFAIVLLWGWVRRWQLHGLSTHEELLFWQLVMVIILLSGPLTWDMNDVWLLPVAAIIVRQFKEDTGSPVSTAFLILGLLLAGIPDHFGFPLLTPYGYKMDNYKYIAAELLIFLGLLISFDRTRHTRERTGS